MNRRFWLGLLLVPLAACVSTDPPGGRTGNWSDVQSWPGGALPEAGQAVTIPAGTTMTLDVSTPALKSLTVQGTLRFADKDLELTTGYILLDGGHLQVGSDIAPFTKQATITLTGADTGADTMSLGEKFIGVLPGGDLDLHGQTLKSWTRLSSTAKVGDKSITVQDSSGWQVGNRIAIASTDYDYTQAEEAIITAISGNTLTLDTALKYMHYGQAQTFAGKTLESRAEVALLHRNVIVRGDDNSAVNGFGGHIMAMGTGKIHLENVELTRMGQKGKLRRYPIHFHMQGNDAAGSYVKNSVIHHVFNRCLTIHSTANLLIQNNAAFDTIGHCYFLEDAGETGNTLEGNLGFKVRSPDTKSGEVALLPTDTQPAVFWITNPANTFRNNVAAGSEDFGFWVALPAQPTGPSSTDTRFSAIYPRRTAFTEFKGNLAHSDGNTGLNVDGGPNKDTLASETTYYAARANPVPPAPGTADSAIVPVVFQDFTAYRNRTRGVWLRGSTHTLLGAMLADNGIGATFASNESFVQDSVIVGETANLGTPSSYEISQGLVGLDGRTLPYPYNKGKTEYGTAHPIRGYEFYDGRVGAKNVTFVNFQPNTLRAASAISYLRFTAFSIDPRNGAEALQFVNTNPVYLKLEKPEPTAPNDDGMDGYRSAVFLDKDGSVSGSSANAGKSIVVNNPFLLNANCEAANTAWGEAHVCNNTYGRFFWQKPDDNLEVSPVVITRLEDTNPQHNMWGTPNGNANDTFETRLILGKSYSLALNGALPNRSSVNLYNRLPGDFVRVALPWSGEAFLYRDYYIAASNRLAAATSQADLDASTGNKYFLDAGTLYLKLQVNTTRDYARIELCKTDLCK